MSRAKSCCSLGQETRPQRFPSRHLHVVTIIRGVQLKDHDDIFSKELNGENQHFAKRRAVAWHLPERRRSCAVRRVPDWTRRPIARLSQPGTAGDKLPDSQSAAGCESTSASLAAAG